MVSAKAPHRRGYDVQTTGLIQGRMDPAGLHVETYRKKCPDGHINRSWETWHLRGGCTVPDDVRNLDEHMIIERKDHTFWMLVRTKYGIGESFSTDQGHKWSPLVPSEIKHPTARFFIRRLKSGNLLLVKHDPLDRRTDRSQLTAYLSVDDGITWTGGLLLDERKGVSYPDGQQAADGTIHIIYDYNRTSDQLILMASFTEKEVITGNPDSENVSLRKVVSKGGLP
jgi:hypothetical protein